MNTQLNTCNYDNHNFIRMLINVKPNLQQKLQTIISICIFKFTGIVPKYAFQMSYFFYWHIHCTGIYLVKLQPSLRFILQWQ